MAIKGHKKMGGQKWEKPWPRKQILKHTDGKCPHCGKHCKNLEEHARARHISKKKVSFEGTVHGHD